MRAGRLRHSVTIQQETETKGDHGELTRAWTTFATVRAGIFPLRGREFIDMHVTNNEINHRIEMRYLSGIVPAMRVLFGSRVFEIIVPLNIESMNRDLHLMCVEPLYGTGAPFFPLTVSCIMPDFQDKQTFINPVGVPVGPRAVLTPSDAVIPLLAVLAPSIVTVPSPMI